jgi:hypothetical protein
MSKRHEVSRRRTYARRRHEIRERDERRPGLLDWIDEAAERVPAAAWRADRASRAANGPLLPAGGID